MKKLTNAEEEIMLVVWDLKKAFANEIRENLPLPKPAYTTVATTAKILVKKGFLGYTAIKNAHQYFPTISRDAYKKKYFNNLMDSYFNGSYLKFALFFSKNKNISRTELERIRTIFSQEIKERSKKTDIVHKQPDELV